MPYEYLEDLSIADVAFRAEGATLSEVFAAAWEATLRVLIELPLDRELPLDPAGPGQLRPRMRRAIVLSNPDPDLLLHGFLEEQLYRKDAEGLLLRLESCRVTRHCGHWTVRAQAAGERPDPARHSLGTDVKAVTFHQFSLTREHGCWRAVVVLDV